MELTNKTKRLCVPWNCWLSPLTITISQHWHFSLIEFPILYFYSLGWDFFRDCSLTQLWNRAITFTNGASKGVSGKRSMNARTLVRRTFRKCVLKKLRCCGCLYLETSAILYSRTGRERERKIMRQIRIESAAMHCCYYVMMGLLHCWCCLSQQLFLIGQDLCVLTRWDNCHVGECAVFVPGITHTFLNRKSTVYGKGRLWLKIVSRQHNWNSRDRFLR